LPSRAKAEKVVNKVERRREAKATTVRKVRLARVCAMGGRTWRERRRRRRRKRKRRRRSG